MDSSREFTKAAEHTRLIYDKFGQRKPMSIGAISPKEPHYFLHRTFGGEQDLLIIFNTKRCQYQCYFCQLPAKSSRTSISAQDVYAQFEYVIMEMKNSLSILDRITMSNDGSVLDDSTFPREALFAITTSINELRQVRKVVLETRLEFVTSEYVRKIQRMMPKVRLDILTGFETLSPRIRDAILGKKEPLVMFEAGLSKVAEVGADLTAYVLYKPDPQMSDEEAFKEAEESIDYLVSACLQRRITLSIRINPMYMAQGSRWAISALRNPDYLPPRLTDIMHLSEKKLNKGVKIYIGLSTEGLADEKYTYKAREDFSGSLIRFIKLFNDGKISSFTEVP